MRYFYTLCTVLCLLLLNTVQAQNTYDTPCDAFTNPWTGWGATDQTQTESEDLTGMAPFDTDMAIPQDFGCAGAENAMFAKLNIDYNTAYLEIEHTGGSANNISVALFGLTDECPAGTSYGEILYSDPAGVDMTECDLIGNSPVQFDLCGFTTAEFDNLYLWVSSPSADEGDFTIDVTQVVTPSNDDCANAETIGTGTLNKGGQICEINTTNLNACPGPNYTGACYSDFSTGSTVWYEFMTGADVDHISVEIDHENNDVTFALIELPGGCGPPPTRQNVFNTTIDGDYCNAITNGEDSLTQLPVHPNTTYYIIVNTPSADAGDFDLCVSSCNGPSNDLICNAEVVTFDSNPDNTVTATGNTFCASIFWLDHSANTFTNFDCPGPGSSVDPLSAVFYKLDVDPNASRIQIFGEDISGVNTLSAQIFSFDDESECPGSSYTVSTYMQPASGDCNFDGTMLTLDLCEVDPTTYDDLYLYVATERDDQGEFEIEVKQEIAPTNDLCEDPSDPNRGAEPIGPTSLPSGPPVLNIGDQLCENGESNRGACPDAIDGNPCFTDFNNEATVWYTFETGTDVEMVTAEVDNAPEGVRLALFELTGGCGSVIEANYPGMLSEYCTDDSDMDGVDSVWNLTVRMNTVYYLAVSSDSTEWGDFDICVRNCSPPMNDQPCNAEVATLNADPDAPYTVNGTTVCANPLYGDNELTSLNAGYGCPDGESVVFYELDVDPYATYIKVFGESLTSGVTISAQIVSFSDECNRGASPPYGNGTFAMSQPDAGVCDIENEYVSMNLCGLTQAEKEDLYLQVGTDRLNQGDFELNIYQEIAPENDMCDDPSSASREAEDLGEIGVGTEACLTGETNRGACPDAISADACFSDFENEATVWYRFNTGTDVELLSIDVEHENDEVRLALFQLGTAGNCMDPIQGIPAADYPADYCVSNTSNGIDSVWKVLVQENTDYFVAVSTDTSEWGEFDICIKNCTPPGNDRLCDVSTDMTYHIVPGEETETDRNAVIETGTTVCANNFFADFDLTTFVMPNCATVESAVFYKIDVDDFATELTITGNNLDGINTLAAALFVPQNGACPGAPRDFSPAVWLDADGNPLVTCDLGSGEISFDLCPMSIEAKDSLWLWVGSERKDQGAFELELSQKVAPENDDCEFEAQEVDGRTMQDAQCITGTNLFACPDEINLTQDPPGMVGLGCYVDTPAMGEFAGVWYEFTTDATGELLDVTLTHTNTNEVHFALYAKNPDCGNLLPVLCEQDNDDGIIDHIQDYGINPDTTYLMYVYTSKANWGEFELCFDVKEIPPCDGDPPRFFNHTTPICGLDALDNYCIDMTAGNYQYSGQQWPGCGGSWALHNPNWFSFIAGAENLEIDIYISACNSNQGTQVALYELPCDQDFDPNEPGINPETLAEDLISPCSYAACNTGLVTFTNVTKVGQLYGIVFDGCNGDVCHIEIDIQVGGDPPELPDGELEEPTFPDEELGFNQDTICWGAEDVPFMIESEVEGACRYIWTLNGDSIPDATNMLTEFIDFDDPLMPGIHEVCVSASNYCDTTEPVCIEVLVVALDPYITHDTICEGESYTWTGPFDEVLGEFGPFDGLTSDQNLEYMEVTENSFSCEVPAELYLFVRNENDEDPTPIDTFICHSDLPYSIFGVDITGPVNDHEVSTISPYTQCDTFFGVNLTVFGGNFFVTPSCDGQGNMIFSFDPLEDPDFYTNWFDQFQIFENNPDFSLEVQWTSPGNPGVILGDSLDLLLSQDSIEKYAIGDIMTLNIQLIMRYKGEVFCQPISPDYEFYLSHNFPEILSIAGDSTYCPGQQDLELYANVQDPIAPVQGFPDPVSFYQWYPPDGFTIEPPSTSTSDTIFITSPGGQPMDSTVCLVVTTGSCMFTDSLCTDLEAELPEQPILEPDNETCDTSWSFNPSFASSGGWSIIDTPPSGNTATFSSLSDPSATVSVSEPGVYTFEWREGPTDCALYDTVTIDFLESPEMASRMDTCYFGVNFVSIIDFDGGTPDYSIDPASTISGDIDPTTGVFTSDTIEIIFTGPGTNYGDTLELIVVDSKGCVSDTIEIRLVCECDTEAGEMATDTLEACEGDIVSANYLGGHNNDGDDTLMYVLHTGDTSELGTVLETNIDGSFSFDPSDMTLGTIYYISRVIGNAIGDEVDLSDPCLAVPIGQPAIWYETPVANAGSDTTLCGYSYSLNATPSVGDGLWTVEPDDGNVSIDDPTDPNSSVTYDDAGTYTFTWTETNEICVDSAEVDVTLTGEIVPLISTVCNATATEFDVRIVLTGGGGDYILVGISDSSLVDDVYLDGDTVIATGIPKDSVVIFTIDNDLGCGPVEYPVTTSCVCETQIGSLSGPALQACSDGCIDVSTLNYDTTGQNFDANDTLSWVLHTSSDDTLLIPNFIAQSASGEFCYDDISNDVDFGDTVYLSRIAGNHIGGGRVDINDPCQQITFGVSVVFNERPVADAGPDMDVCELSASLSATTSVGEGTWTYVGGPSTNVTFSSPNDANTNVDVEEYGTHTFEWTEDNEGCTSSDSVDLTFQSYPDVENLEITCDDIASSFSVSFDIISGDNSTYEVSGTAGTLTGNTFTSEFIPNDSTYTFYVTDSNRCDTTIVTGTHICPCITEIGSLEGDQQDLCRNTGVSGVSYNPAGEVRDGNDVLVYVLLNDEDSIIATSGSPNFFFNPGTMNLDETYYIRVYLGNGPTGSFDFDDRCTVLDGDIPVTWYDFPTPRVEHAFDEITCTRESIELDGSGSIGNNLSYAWSTDSGQIEQPTDEAIVTITKEGDYTLTITDELSGCTADTTITITKSADIPNAIIAPPATLTCDVLEVELDGSGSSSGPTISYEWTDENGVVIDTTTIIDVDAAGTYTLTVIDNSNNCDISEEVTVEVDRELPDVSASVSDQLSCSITEVSIDGDVTSSGNVTYDWSTDDGNIIGSTTGISITADLPGDYVFVVTNTDNGCVDSTTATVTENPNALTAIDVEANSPRCHDETNGNISITPTGGEAPITYQLINDDNGSLISENQNGTFTNLGPGNYRVEVSDVNGCFESDTMTLVNPPLISIDISESVIIEEGDSVVVEAILPPGAIYDTLIWDTDTVDYICLDSACTIIQLSPFNETEVIATLIGGVGCTDEDRMKIIVKVVRDVYIPNIFSPNGDGINDEFLPMAGRRVVSINNMQVYDRWGSLIFESRNFQPGETQFGWDGTYKGERMAPAVFVYKVEVEYDNGDVEILNGTVTLTR